MRDSRAAARAEYEALARQDPEDPDVHAALGTACLACGDHTGARAAYRRCLALSPAGRDAPRVRRVLARLDAEAGG